VLGAAAVFAAAGCSRSGGSQPTPDSDVVLPTGPAPVVSWSLTGGYLTAGRLALRPPRLAIYADGVVVADAAYRSDLTTSAIADLVARVAEDLRGSNVTKRRDGVAPVADASVTVLSVRSGRGTQSATAEGLDELREKDGYPTALYDARDRIAAVHQRVVSTGQPYTADRVRLVTESGSAEATQPQPWPTAITLPLQQAAGDVRLADLTGQCAKDTVRLVARDLDLNGAWTAYRTASGGVVRASWRYLLPDE
jgi:hypothetical protein